MDDDERAALKGALAAYAFMLENLWAIALADRGATATDAIATGRDMLRQFEDLPPAGDLGADHDLALAHGAERLEKLWARIAKRLDSRRGSEAS